MCGDRGIVGQEAEDLWWDKLGEGPGKVFPTLLGSCVGSSWIPLAPRKDLVFIAPLHVTS